MQCTEFAIVYPPSDCDSQPHIELFHSIYQSGANLVLKVTLDTFGGGNIPAMTINIGYTQFNLVQNPNGGGTMTPDSGIVIDHIPAQMSSQYNKIVILNPNRNTFYNPSTGIYRTSYQGSTTGPCNMRGVWLQAAADFHP